MVVKNPREIVDLYDGLINLFAYRYPQVSLVTLFEKALQFFSSVNDQVNIDFCLVELGGYGLGDFDDAKSNVNLVPKYRYLKLRSDNEEALERLRKHGKAYSIVGEQICVLENACYNYVFPPPLEWTQDSFTVYATEADLIHLLGEIKSELRKRVYSKEIIKLIVEMRSLSLESIDSLIVVRCGDLFADSKYLDAVRAADVLVEEIIRKATKNESSTINYANIIEGLYIKKSTLMHIKLTKDDPTTSNEAKSAHNGVVSLMLAMNKLSRNPHMHRDTGHNINANDCYAMLWNYTTILKALREGGYIN